MRNDYATWGMETDPSLHLTASTSLIRTSAEMAPPKPKWDPAHITTMLAYITMFRDAPPQDRDGIVEETWVKMQHIESDGLSHMSEGEQKIVSTGDVKMTC